MTQETKERIIALGEKRRLLVEELPTKPSGLAWCAKHARLANEVVHLLYDDLLGQFSEAANLAIIATGGFGRSELCPRSDIDITVVPRDEASPNLDHAIRKLYQDLHWAYGTVLRLDIGYSYRLVSDAPGLDAKTRTGLLEMRLLAGSQELYMELEESLHSTFTAGEFILAKIEERNAMYGRFNDTPLVSEPNLKEGAGGLRDFHCANWVREAIGQRPVRPTSAYDTVVRYRNLLHYISKKPQDLLSRSRLEQLSELLELPGSHLLNELIGASSQLHRGFQRTKERLFEARFPLSSAALSVAGEVRILPDSSAGEAAVGVAIATKLGLRVGDLPAKAGNFPVGPAAAFAISTGEETIRNLDRCTLLEQLLPELVACRTLVPEDGVHTYTVMEHSLRVVRCLDSLDETTFLGDLKASITDLNPLYLAAVLHDIGKSEPEFDHSVFGAHLARTVCKRWGLDESFEDTVAWLVEEHLTMARFMRIRDLQLASTIDEFAEIVRDAERLKLLTLLTWADVSAVAPGAWTSAQGTFLRQLYESTALRLQGEFVSAPDAFQSRQRLIRHLKSTPDVEKIQGFLDSMPVHYLISSDAALVRLHLELAERAREGHPTIEHFTRADLGASEVTVCSLDVPGLLSQLLGGFYAHDLSLLGVKASTTSTTPPVALDVFTVAFGGRPVPPATMVQVSRTLLELLEGRITVEDLLRAKGKDPTRQQKLFEYTFIPGNPAILEIRAPRGRGMAFRFSKFFAAKGWNIVGARAGQWAGTASAAFYLTGPNGTELGRKELESSLGEELSFASTRRPGSP